MIGMIKELLYLHGFKLGRFLVVLPIATDLIFKNAREWNLASIGIVGVLCQLIGLLLIQISPRDAKL